MITHKGLKLGVITLFSLIINILPVQSQVSICLGDDVTVCQGQSVTINDCSSSGSAPTGALVMNNPTVINLSDDQYSGVVNLGFTFNFFGTNQTQCVISSNGYIRFGTTGAGGFSPWTLNGTPLPSTTMLANVRNAIMPAYSDINPQNGAAGNLQYQTIGTAPNRKFVLLWREIGAFSCGGLCNYFGLILNETSNVIEMYVGSKPVCGGWNGGYAIQGIQNAAGTVAYTTPGRNNSVWVGNNDGYIYTPASPSNTNTYTIAAAPYLQILGTGSSIVWANTNGQTFPYNNGVINVTNIPAGGVGYYLSGSTCGVPIGSLSDTSWLSQSTITATVTTQTDFCYSGVGSATVNNPAGDGPFTYSWSPSGQTGQTATNLVSGTHSVTITNSLGCTRLYNVNVPNNPATATATHTPVTCTGGSDGTATATLNPAVGTITYNWYDAGGQTTQTATGLSAGTYHCEITSSTGCVDTAVVTVTTITPMVASITFQSDVTCNSGSDGVVSVSVNNGTAPYYYQWDNSSSTASTANDLMAGNHEVTITDANGCVTSISTTLSEPNPIVITNITPDLVECRENDVTLSVTAQGGNGVYNYEWILNEQVVSNSNTFTTQPLNPYNEYCVTVSESCGSPVAQECVIVTWPSDIQILLIPSVSEGCFPVEITFVNATNSNDIDNVFTRFGDGYSAISTGNNGFYHIYETPGVYSVKATLTTNAGCVYDTTFVDMITVHDYPRANFSWMPFMVPMFNPEVDFTNLSSSDVVNWDWTFYDGTPQASSDSDPSTVYPEGIVDNYLVTLIVTNDAGCQDSIAKEVSVVSDVLLFAPNAFTPDGDKFNETWRVYIDGIDIYNFDLFIFNRWGEVIWESHNPEGEWDGTYGGKVVPEGMYIWTLRATDGVTDKKYEFNGHINVLK